MIDTFFPTILLASRDAAMIALAVFVLLTVAKHRVSPAWRHGLWLLVALRLVLPLLPASPVSWQRILPDPVSEAAIETNASTISPVAQQAIPETAAEVSIELPEGMPETLVESESPPFWSWRRAVILAWMSGAALFLFLIFFNAIKTRTRIKRLTKSHPRSDELVDLLQKVAREAGFKRSPALRITGAITSPAVTGLIRPKILLPTNLASDLSPDELRLILFHELGHLRRRDLWTNWALSLLQAVHWFNPLVWYAFRRVRVEAESACDAWVLHRIGQEQSQAYGNILIRLLEFASPSPVAPGVVGVLENRKDLRNRIGSIARYSKKNWWTVVVGAVMFATMAMVGLTKAPEQEEQPDPVEVTVNVTGPDGSPAGNAELWIKEINLEKPVKVYHEKADQNGQFQTSLTPAVFPGMSPDPKVYFEVFVRTTEGHWGSKQCYGQTEVTVAAKYPSGSVKVRVVDEEGDPVPDLLMYLAGFYHHRDFMSFWMTVMPDGLWSAKTDKDGICLIKSIPRNIPVYLNHNDSKWSNVSGSHHPSGFGHLAVQNPGEPAEIKIYPAAKVTGQVLLPDGKPAPGIQVALRETSYHVHGGAGGQLTTDETGTFEFLKLPPSEYKLDLDYSNLSDRDWTAEGKTFVLRSGETLSGTALKLAKGSILIKGKVYIKETGEVPSLNMWLAVESSKPGRSVAVGKDGTFEFRLFPGKSKVTLTHSGMIPPGLELKSRFSELDLKENETKTLDFVFEKTATDPSMTVSGVVLDSEGNPTAAQYLSTDAEKVFIGYWPWTDEKGKFAVPASKANDTVELFAYREKDFTALTEAKPGEESALRFLTAGQKVRLHGKVVDEEGNSLAGVSMQVSHNMSSERYKSKSWTGYPHEVYRDLRTKEDGSFDVYVLPNQTFELSFWGKGVTRGRISEVESGDAGEIHKLEDLVLKRANKSISGIVMDRNGEPVEAVKVTLENRSLSTYTNTEGRFTLTGLPPGEFEFAAIQETEEIARVARLKARPGGTDLKFELPDVTEATLTGKLIDHNGKPLGGVQLEAERYVRKTVTKADGSFEMKGLMDGWFNLSIWHDAGNGFPFFRVRQGLKDVRIPVMDSSVRAIIHKSEPKNLVGKSASELRLHKWGRGEFDTALNNGRIKIINFSYGMFRTKKVLKDIEAFWTENQSKGIDFVSVHQYKYIYEMTDFSKRYPQATFPIAVLEPIDQNLLDYDVRKWPCYVVIDGRGVIRHYGKEFLKAAEAASELLK